MSTCECGCGRSVSRGSRFRLGHHRRKSPVAFVSDPSTGCWNWQRKTADGYGQQWIGGRYIYAHRHYYELLVGLIPPGLTLDHLCRNRACVNPAHLEPVSLRENNLRGESPPAVNARKTECKYGHAFDQSNTYLWRGQRFCRTCRARHNERKPHGI